MAPTMRQHSTKVPTSKKSVIPTKHTTVTLLVVVLVAGCWLLAVSASHLTPLQQLKESRMNIAPTIDYSHNMRILKLPAATKPGSLIYRLKATSAGSLTAPLNFGPVGVESRQLLEIVPVARAWNEADVYLRAPLAHNSVHNLTIFVSDGSKTTQVDSTLIATSPTSVDLLAGEPVSQHSTSSLSTGSPAPSSNCPTQSSMLPFVNTKLVYEVPESASSAEAFGSLAALESDSSSLPVKFELRGANSQHFALRYVFGAAEGQTKAELVVGAEPLDYERQNLYSLQVLAINGWTNKALDTRNVAAQNILIVVNDVQDSPPIFRQVAKSPSSSSPQAIFNVKLTGELRVNDLLLKLEAEDGDYADQRPVSFALESSSPLLSYVTLNSSSGELRLAKPIGELLATWHTLSDHNGDDDDAGDGSRTLTVYASEMQDSSSFEHLWPPMVSKAQIRLYLADVRNEAPRFFFVPLQQQQEGQHQHRELSLEQAIDERHAHLEADVDELSAASGALIADWRQWTPQNASVADDADKAPIIGRLLVADFGVGAANGSFELALEGRDAASFRLEPQGRVARQTQVYLFAVPAASRNSNFDFDSLVGQRQTFELTLVARDFGRERRTSKLRMLVTLQDSNDNSPQFSQPHYSAAIYESARLGETVAYVSAADKDSGQRPNSKLRYSKLNADLQAGDFNVALSHRQRISAATMTCATPPFNVEPMTGRVYVGGPLDREACDKFELLIEARDLAGGRASNSNITSVAIAVLDVNDNAPQFALQHYSAVLAPDGNFHVPLVVYASDADEPGSANAKVAYEIVAGNLNQLFAIDPSSGVISLAGAGASPTLPSLSQPDAANYPAVQSPQQQQQRPPEVPRELSEPLSPFGGNGGGGGRGRGDEREFEELRARPASAPQASNRQRASSVHYATPLASSAGASEPLASSLDLLLSLESALSDGPAAVTEVFVDGASDGSQARRNLSTPIAERSGDSTSHSHSHAHGAAKRHLASVGYFSDAQTGAKLLPPVTTLVVRAHDFGIPAKSATVKVDIHNEALASRQLSVILNGTSEQLEARRRDLERAVGALTGSRAQIEAIETLTDSSALSVARFRLSLPLHGLVDLTDLSKLAQVLDLRAGSSPQSSRLGQHYSGNLHSNNDSGSGSGNGNGHDFFGSLNDPRNFNQLPHRTSQQRPHKNSANISISSEPAADSSQPLAADTPSLTAEPPFSLERRLLIYIIIVGVCILSLLVVWMIYVCSREEKIKLVEKQLGGGGGHMLTTTAATGRYVNAGTEARLSTVSSQMRDFQAALSNSSAGHQTEAKQQNSAGSDVIERYGKTALATSKPSNGSQAHNSSLDSNGQLTELPTIRQQMSQRQQQQQRQSTSNDDDNEAEDRNFAATSRPAHLTTTAVAGKQRVAAALASAAQQPDAAAKQPGQLWFEATTPSTTTGDDGTTRRVSSAPSTGNSVLNNGRQIKASGQFFPNSRAYMQNLNAMALDSEAQPSHGFGSKQTKNQMLQTSADLLDAAEIGGQEKSGRRGLRAELASRRQRRRRVAPMSDNVGRAGANPKFVGHTNSAFEVDENETEDFDETTPLGDDDDNETDTEVDSRGNPIDPTASSATSVESLLLNSDQELLGFDSTGTPIIATHTRPPPISTPLVVAPSSMDGLSGPPQSRSNLPPIKSASQQEQNSTESGNLEAETAKELSISDSLKAQNSQVSPGDLATDDAPAAQKDDDLLDDMKNKELLDKKSIFAIAYNDIANTKLPPC